MIMKLAYAMLVILLLPMVVIAPYWGGPTKDQANKEGMVSSYKAVEAMSGTANAEKYGGNHNNTAQDWVHQGDTYFRKGDMDSAQDAYDTAIRLDSNSTGAWIGKGKVLGTIQSIDMNAWEGAVEAYDKAIELDPLNQEAWRGLASMLGSITTWTNNVDDKRQFNNAVDVAHQHPINLSDQRSAAALSDHKNRTAHSKPTPQTAADWIALGNTSSGRPNGEAKAIEAYDKAVELDPNSVVALRAKGELLTRIGFRNPKNYEEAVKLFDKAIDIDPTKKRSTWADLHDALTAMNAFEAADHIQQMAGMGSGNIDLNDPRSSDALTDHANRVKRLSTTLQPRPESYSYNGWTVQFDVNQTNYSLRKDTMLGSGIGAAGGEILHIDCSTVELRSPLGIGFLELVIMPVDEETRLLSDPSLIRLIRYRLSDKFTLESRSEDVGLVALALVSYHGYKSNPFENIRLIHSEQPSSFLT